MAKQKKLSVLMAGAELAPLVKVGGLGDVMGALPKAIARNGAKASVIIPFYGLINRRKFPVKLVKKGIKVDIDRHQEKFDLYKTKLPGSPVIVYLVKHKMFDPRAIYVGKRKYFKNKKGNIYSREIRDVERFIFFSKTVAESIRVMRWHPDVVHAHDWHMAALPTFIDEYNLADDHFDNIKTLFTIHNLANQGITGLDIIDYAGLHIRWTPALMEEYYDRDGDAVDLMKVGILSADYVNTVSPNYAKEILTKEYGEGLEKYLLRRSRKHLMGILNGIDWKLFDPSTDKFIKKQYSAATVFKNKAINKAHLQKSSKLEVDANIPLFGLVSRLVGQKGLDIMIPALAKVLAKNEMQVVVLGTGQEKYEKGLQALEKKFPRKFRANITFDIKLAQEIYAGSDFFLMPSRFEPCGLGQMIAMRYGTLPVVRKTGGLKDTVTDGQTGFVFDKYTTTAMVKVLKRSLQAWSKQAKIKKMIRNSMKQDHSWEAAAKQYLKLYKKLK